MVHTLRVVVLWANLDPITVVLSVKEQEALLPLPVLALRATTRARTLLHSLHRQHVPPPTTPLLPSTCVWMSRQTRPPDVSLEPDKIAWDLLERCDGQSTLGGKGLLGDDRQHDSWHLLLDLANLSSSSLPLRITSFPRSEDVVQALGGGVLVVGASMPAVRTGIDDSTAFMARFQQRGDINHALGQYGAFLLDPMGEIPSVTRLRLIGPSERFIVHFDCNNSQTIELISSHLTYYHDHYNKSSPVLESLALVEEFAHSIPGSSKNEHRIRTATHPALLSSPQGWASTCLCLSIDLSRVIQDVAILPPGGSLVGLEAARGLPSLPETEEAMETVLITAVRASIRVFVNKYRNILGGSTYSETIGVVPLESFFAWMAQTKHKTLVAVLGLARPLERFLVCTLWTGRPHAGVERTRKLVQKHVLEPLLRNFEASTIDKIILSGLDFDPVLSSSMATKFPEHYIDLASVQRLYGISKGAISAAVSTRMGREDECVYVPLMMATYCALVASGEDGKEHSDGAVYTPESVWWLLDHTPEVWDSTSHEDAEEMLITALGTTRSFEGPAKLLFPLLHRDVQVQRIIERLVSNKTYDVRRITQSGQFVDRNHDLLRLPPTQPSFSTQTACMQAVDLLLSLRLVSKKTEPGGRTTLNVLGQHSWALLNKMLEVVSEHLPQRRKESAPAGPRASVLSGPGRHRSRSASPRRNGTSARTPSSSAAQSSSRQRAKRTRSVSPDVRSRTEIGGILRPGEPVLPVETLAMRLAPAMFGRYRHVDVARLPRTEAEMRDDVAEVFREILESSGEPDVYGHHCQLEYWVRYPSNYPGSTQPSQSYDGTGDLLIEINDPVSGHHFIGIDFKLFAVNNTMRATLGDSGSRSLSDFRNRVASMLAPASLATGARFYSDGEHLHNTAAGRLGPDDIRRSYKDGNKIVYEKLMDVIKKNDQQAMQYGNAMACGVQDATGWKPGIADPRFTDAGEGSTRVTTYSVVNIAYGQLYIRLCSDTVVQRHLTVCGAFPWLTHDRNAHQLDTAYEAKVATRFWG